MLKKFILIFTLILLGGVKVFAADNYLNSVVIENSDDAVSIVLRSDDVAKIKKEIESPDKIILNLKGIMQSPDISTLYKNTSKVEALTIQNEGKNGLKIYIDAPDIAKANIIFDTPNSAPLVLKTGISEKRAVWSIISIVLLLIAMRSARNSQSVLKLPDKNELIKEREKAMYKTFQKEVKTLPSINYRLKAYSKHVLKGETIRSYENRMSSKI